MPMLNCNNFCLSGGSFFFFLMHSSIAFAMVTQEGSISALNGLCINQLSPLWP